MPLDNEALIKLGFEPAGGFTGSNADITLLSKKIPYIFFF